MSEYRKKKAANLEINGQETEINAWRQRSEIQTFTKRKKKKNLVNLQCLKKPEGELGSLIATGCDMTIKKVSVILGWLYRVSIF